MVDLTTLIPGQVISFLSKETFDQITHVGTVEAIGKFSMTTKYGDIVSRYQGMRKQDPTQAPMADLTYFVIRFEQNGLVEFFIIARDWIEPSSVVILDIHQFFDIRILNRLPEIDAQTVLDLLREAGFLCKLLKP